MQCDKRSRRSDGGPVSGESRWSNRDFPEGTTRRVAPLDAHALTDYPLGRHVLTAYLPVKLRRHWREQ
jgi:hypothetical protein